MSNQNNQVANQPKQNVQLSPSDRFTNAVLSEFTGGRNNIQVSEFQRTLISNYFIKLDLSLAEAEQNRLAKSEKYRDNTPITWNNVDIKPLALKVVAYSKLGLDPTQSNHISMIPYKNNKTGKYDIGFIEGYKGIEIKSKKYGLDTPDNVVVELIYSNDTFKQFKKDQNNPIEKYQFEINDTFNRGDFLGGFYYLEYFNNPEKNKIRVMTKRDIEKRKPERASVEFWGGNKDVWENGKKVGTKEVEGWFEEMATKTLTRAAYNSLTIDAEKIDENYRKLILMQSDQAAVRISDEIEANANKEEIGFDNTVDTEAEVVDENKEDEPVATEGQTQLTGPGF